MTHIVHPHMHRLGILRDWKSRWFTTDPKRYRENLQSDSTIREYLKKRLKGMYVSVVNIERNDREVKIVIKTSRPGLIIGRSGEGAQKLQQDLEKVVSKLNLSHKPQLKIDVEEVRSPESDAAIVAQMVAESLEKRFPFRRIIKQVADKVMANRDVLGVRVTVAGRLGGAEMARRESIKKGRIPLQTFRSDVDFAKLEAHLPYGAIGIKVWIYRGDVFENKKS
jgi:small subunit ribosomal protein S3